jgi:uncharacterized protein YggE
MTGSNQAATVAVTGTGRVERTADLALATFVIEATRPTAADARRDAAGVATAVIEALAGAGIPRADLRTAGLDLVPNWEQEGNRSVRRGFTVTNRVGATVRDLELVGRVIDAGLAAGATGLDGVQLLLADPAPAADEARRLAVADARARAEAIVSAAGLSLGRLVSIAEGGAGPAPMPHPAMRLEAFAADVPTPVLPGRIEVSVSVSAVWELA